MLVNAADTLPVRIFLVVTASCQQRSGENPSCQDSDNLFLSYHVVCPPPSGGCREEQIVTIRQGDTAEAAEAAPAA
eukprot:scaffold100031_cov72-Phaeocystis_antarctica.AAC.6